MRAKLVIFTAMSGRRRVGFLLRESQKTVKVLTRTNSGRAMTELVVSKKNGAVSFGPNINADERNLAFAEQEG